MVRILSAASTSKLAALIKTLIAILCQMHVPASCGASAVRPLAVKLWHCLNIEERLVSGFFILRICARIRPDLPVWHTVRLSTFVVAQEWVRVQVSCVVVDIRLVASYLSLAFWDRWVAFVDSL